ncbi:MAG: jacalin-like lectin [Cyanobacteria bacterium J06576_12]
MATQSYLEENSEIPWEPWQSTAVGGNEGDTFSDINVSPMHLDATKERYQTARVKEVRVWIKNWVEGVQIVLEGDNIPPPRTHGNEAGDLKILRLAPGDYITAVSVMPGSPQRILVDRGTYVGSIKIQTHKQPDWVVGTPDPNAIALDIPKDYQVIGFHGRSGDRIRKLGVISIPIHHQS